MSGEAMDNLVWNDLWASGHTVKVYALCCSKYANQMRKRKRIIDWVVIIVPIIGVALYPISSYYTLVAAIFTALCAIIEKCLPLLTQPEAELCTLDNLQTEFEKILSEIEDAVHSFRIDDTTDIQLKGYLKKWKKHIAVMRTEMDKLVRKAPDSEKLNAEAEIYMYSKFTSILSPNE